MGRVARDLNGTPIQVHMKLEESRKYQMFHLIPILIFLSYLACHLGKLYHEPISPSIQGSQGTCLDGAGKFKSLHFIHVLPTILPLDSSMTP